MSLHVVLSLAPAVEDRLLPELVAEGHVVVARAAGAADAAAVTRAGVDVVLASSTSRHLDPALVRAAVAAGARLVAVCERPEDAATARAAGAAVTAPDTATLAELLAATEGEASPPAGRAAPPTRGRVITVWGPAGAPGRTTTAIAVASEVAATGLRTVLVDADTIGAAVAPSLGLVDEAPGIAAACRLAAAGALDGAELDRVAQRVPGSRGVFSVLTGIGRPSRWPELSAERVTKVLDACRERFDAVIVDAGFNLEADEEIVSDLFAPRRNAATIASVQGADRLVAVGAADPVGLARFVRAYGDLLELVGSGSVSVLATKVRSSAVGLNPGGQVRASLLRFGGIEDVALVPHDPVACDTALLTARPLPDAAPRSAPTAAIRNVVERDLLPALRPPVMPERHGWRPRRRSRAVKAGPDPLGSTGSGDLLSNKS